MEHHRIFCANLGDVINRRNPMKPTLLSVLLLSILAITGCETVQGAGKDLSKAGDAIANESRAVQADL
jgi:predicted small secreted protein